MDTPAILSEVNMSAGKNRQDILAKLPYIIYSITSAFTFKHQICNTELYCDDTTIHSSAANIEKIVEILSEDLETVDTSYSKKDVLINVAKTKTVNIQT